MNTTSLKAGTRIHVEGDSSVLWIQDYNVRVCTDGTVDVDASPKDKKVLVTLDEIDGEQNVSVLVRKSKLQIKEIAPKPGLYRHFKGQMYRVLYTARHTETDELMVVYQATYGDHAIWVRPAVMWNEIVHRDDYVGPRFTFIEE